LGSKSSTQTTSQTTTPINQAALQNIYNTVSGAASTPYQAYAGELVAPVNQQQTAGINAINSASGYASPYIQGAAGLVRSAANPLTADQIQQYQNPYTQSVVNATQAQFNDQNAQAQNALKGNAAAQGALGGDRQAVAQTTLAKNQQLAQAPVIANLYSQGYNQALQTAQQQFQQNPLAAASSLGNLGVAGQNAALQGANAQVNAGTLQQQTQQQADQAAYQQYLQKQGYPFQTAQFLAQYGTPAALAQGTTSNGTQTVPQGNTWSQLAGLGLSAAGMFLKDGGAVPRMADGGSPFSFVDQGGYAKSYVPAVSGNISASLPTSQLQFAKTSDANPWSGATSALTGMKGKFGGESYGGGNIFTDEWGGSSSNPLEGLSKADYGEGFKSGGFVETIHQIHNAVRRASGGAVGTTPFQSYADGGMTFADRYSPIDEATPALADNASPLPVIREVPQQAMDAWRKGVDQPNPAIVADTAMPGPDPSQPVVSSPRPPMGSSSPMTASLPKEITGGEPEPSSAMAYAAPSGPMTAAPAQAIAPEQKFGHSLFGVNLSDKTRQALVAAGLGMMSSRSPFFGAALGEGGLKGLAAYSDLTKEEQAAADKAAQRGQEQQRIDLQAKQLAQSAEQFAKNYGLAKRRVDLSEDKTPEGYRKTKEGNYEAIPGGPTDPDQVAKLAKAKATSSSMDDETADFLADRVLAGDTKALIGLGRGAQGAENLAKINQLVAQKAREGKPVSDAARSILANAAQQSGYVAAERAQAQIMAKLSVYGRTAYNAMDMAERMSDEVPRTQFVPINKAINAWKTNTGDPKIVALGQAIETLTNEYARAIGGGHGTVSDKEHARERLSAAQTPEQLRAVIGTMRQEILLAEHAIPAARQQIRDVYNPSAKGEVTTIEGPKAAPGTPPVIPKAPAGVPPGSAYSPSRNQWKAPDGTIYNADGSKP